MARYADIADLLTVMPQRDLVRFTADDGGVVVVDDVAERALVFACDMIDSYLSNRYTTPLSPVPPVVQQLALRLAAYQLRSRLEAYERDHPRRIDYEDALTLLRDISEGKSNLGVVPELAVQRSQVADISSNPRLFSRTTLRGL